MKGETRAELKKSTPIYTSLLLSSCLGPKGVPNSSQTNSQQPVVSQGFLTVFMLFLQINNSFASTVSPEQIMFGKIQQLCVRSVQESSKYTSSKIILFHGKGPSD